MVKVVRYEQSGAKYGEIRGELIFPLSGEFGAFAPSDESPVDLGSVRLLAPVTPSKIIAIGGNYHAMLNGRPRPSRPFYFLKPSSAVLDPEGVILIPQSVPTAVHESELAIVIGKRARNIPVCDACDVIFGYTCVNDVTGGFLPDVEAHMQSEWLIDGKIFDTFAPIGPFIETDLDTSNLELYCRVNGEDRQRHNTSDMIWTPSELVSAVSHVLTLLPGDVIATGSPPGASPLHDGDLVEVGIEGIGILRNYCKAIQN